jgi:uncharacterized oxidoreductase
MSSILGRPAKVLVTGGTSGIGAELVRRLLAGGHSVIVLARRAGGMDPAERLFPVAADLADHAHLPALMAGVLRRHPDLRVVINNAAVQHARPLTDAASRPEHLAEEVCVNLLAPALIVQAALPVLAANAPAAIVNVTSGLAVFPKERGGLYAASKAGLRSLTTSLRYQAEGLGIAVTEAVLPLVETPMAAGRGAGKLPAGAAAEAILGAMAQGRREVWPGKARALRVIARVAPELGLRIMRRG